MGNNPDYQLSEQSKDEMIRRLSEEKNSLLKIISHDIRGPFNRMFALLQLLEMEFRDSPVAAKEYIDRMYQAVIGGMEMVKNLHDSRAIDQGNITLNLENTSLKQLLRLLIRNFSIQSRLKKITIKYDEGNNDPEIKTDKILLNKVVENVLSNAIKFSEPGGEVSIKLKTFVQNLQVIISDNGPGLPPEEIPLIFNKFQKLSSKPTQGEGSTGLGLYNANVFIQMLSGEIQVMNASGRGLVVIINLPAMVKPGKSD